MTQSNGSRSRRRGPILIAIWLVLIIVVALAVGWVIRDTPEPADGTPGQVSSHVLDSARASLDQRLAGPDFGIEIVDLTATAVYFTQ